MEPYPVIPYVPGEKSGGDSVPALVLWVSIGAVGGITLIAVLVVTIILCKRRSSNSRR